MNISNILNLKRLSIIIILAIVFFGVYGSIYFSLRPQAMDNDMWIFNTPDETANHFFISKLRNENTLTHYEPLNEISGELNLVHPRSTTVVNNHVAPGSFLGFILLLGVLAKIFSLGFVPYITPLVSVFAVACFYLLLKQIFTRYVAFLSTILLLVTPAFWYYNSRSLFNNILFIDLLIIGTYLLFKFYKFKKVDALIASGVLFGLAISLRTSDLVWVGFLVAMMLVFNKALFRLRDLAIMFASALVATLPVLLVQNSLYGSPFVTGYMPTVGEELSSGGFYFNILKQLFFPFGIHVLNAFSNFYYFFIDMFPWHFWPALLGGLLFVYLWKKKRLNKKEQYYFVVTIAISLFVILYYGSWSFFDNLTGQPLIGSSQTRYLLPIYILSLPLIAYLVEWISLRIGNKKAEKILPVMVVLLFTVFSANVVLFKGPESLYSIKDTVINYHDINKQVRAVTEDDSVIVTSYNDKLFFPERKIIFYWQEERFLENIQNIARSVPVYFYSIDWQNDINYIIDNSTMDVELILEINETEFLYRLYP